MTTAPDSSHVSSLKRRKRGTQSVSAIPTASAVGESASMIHATFPGNSEMAQRMREFDWSASSLGSVEKWPQSLKTAVSTSLSCAFPIVLWWGPDLTLLYNDEYRAMLGPGKHPAALGKPGETVWAEIWDIVGPMLRQVMSRGEPTRSRDLMLHINRVEHRRKVAESAAKSETAAQPN